MYRLKTFEQLDDEEKRNAYDADFGDRNNDSFKSFCEDFENNPAFLFHKHGFKIYIVPNPL